MTVRNRQSPVLIDIIRKHQCKKIAEIGVWKGHTERNILRACGNDIDEYWAIDQWAIMEARHGRMSRLSLDDWDSMYKRVCLDMTFFPCLKVARMLSEAAASIIPNGYLDMVFIDASHYYEDVLNDIKLWLPKIKTGGFITGHDYISRRHGDVTRAVDEVFDDVGYDSHSMVWWADVKS